MHRRNRNYHQPPDQRGESAVELRSAGHNRDIYEHTLNSKLMNTGKKKSVPREPKK